MSKIRAWLIDVLIGDYTYIKNLHVFGTIQVRHTYHISCGHFGIGAQILSSDGKVLFIHPLSTPVDDNSEVRG